jgi:hypothetical protein
MKKKRGKRQKETRQVEGRTQGSGGQSCACVFSFEIHVGRGYQQVRV